jgi:uncharacterized damage-inducible protein DinB
MWMNKLYQGGKMKAEGNLELESIKKFWFDEVKPPLMEALEIAPDNKLDWAPAEKALSLGNVFMHIAEASMWWIGKFIDGVDYDELTPGPSLPKDRIKSLLDGHWGRLEDFFKRCPEITGNVYPHTWRGKEYKLTGSWVMLHLLEHDIHHRSQINQYLRILGLGPPKI